MNRASPGPRSTLGRWGALALLAWVGLFPGGCAHVAPPSGGLRDQIPPLVTGVWPAPEARNVALDVEPQFEFSEWIGDRLPRQAITVSPPLAKNPRLVVDGNRLRIELRAPLDSATTYRIELGREVKDLRGTALVRPFQLVFATGAELDSLTLEGLVTATSGGRATEGTVVALYPIGRDERARRSFLRPFDDTLTHLPDSVPRLTKEPPLYRTGCDSTGLFRFRGLRPGNYRMLAFADRNSNGKPDLSESIALADRDLQLAPGATQPPAHLALADLDTGNLRLEGAERMEGMRIGLRFNRVPHADRAFTPSSYRVMRTDSAEQLEIVALYPDAKNGQPVLQVAQGTNDSSYLVIAEALHDSLGRQLDTARSRALFTWLALPDTLPAVRVKTIPAANSETADPAQLPEMIFDRAVTLADWETKLGIALNGDTLKAQVTQPAPNRLRLQPPRPISANSKVIPLEWRNDTLVNRDSLGVADTTVQGRWRSLWSYSTWEAIRLGGLKGCLPGATRTTRVRLNATTRGTEPRDTWADAQGCFAFAPLPEGQYLLESFIDLDGDGVRHPGNIEPFRLAEPLFRMADTLFVPRGDTASLDELLAKPQPEAVP